MDVYQTEEEQVESIKKWWAKNANAVMLGVGVGLLCIFGWQTWNNREQAHALEASDVYQQLTAVIKEAKFDTAIVLANEIDRSYSDTPYAALAGLQKAKALIETGDRKAATSTLEKVASDADNNSLQHIARLRAFRLRVADGEMEKVIADIDAVINEQGGINPGEFIGQYEALKGDAYRLLGNIEKARHGYIAALRSATLEQRLIQLKLDDLGPPPANFAGKSAVDMNAEPEK